MLTESEIERPALLYVCAFYKVVQNIIGPIAVLIIVAMGAKYIMAEDDEKARADAKENIKHVLFGLLIFIVGGALARFLLEPPSGWENLC
jgi:glucose uptake protein GlcU